jgi:hypothetical protein
VADKLLIGLFFLGDYGPSLVEVDMTVIGAHPPYFSYALATAPEGPCTWISRTRPSRFRSAS